MQWRSRLFCLSSLASARQFHRCRIIDGVETRAGRVPAPVPCHGHSHQCIELLTSETTDCRSRLRFAFYCWDVVLSPAHFAGMPRRSEVLVHALASCAGETCAADRWRQTLNMRQERQRDRGTLVGITFAGGDAAMPSSSPSDRAGLRRPHAHLSDGAGWSVRHNGDVSLLRRPTLPCPPKTVFVSAFLG